MKTLGICLSRSVIEEINFETGALYRAGSASYDQVHLIDPLRILYKFIRGQDKPAILLDGHDISDLSTLIVRGTKGQESAVALLARSLALCGCDILSPIWRFSPNRVSKLLGTLARFKRGVGIDSFMAFDFENALRLLSELDASGYFPLLTKPIAGRQGIGITLLPALADAEANAETFFQLRESGDDVYFLQRFIHFQAEYRVFVLDGAALGASQKIRGVGQVAANAAQDARFVAAESPEVIEFVLQNIHSEGILGVDVAVGPDGKRYIIESNRAPLWKSFQEATQTDVAQEIIARALRRLEARL